MTDIDFLTSSFLPHPHINASIVNIFHEILNRQSARNEQINPLCNRRAGPRAPNAIPSPDINNAILSKRLSYQFIHTERLKRRPKFSFLSEYSPPWVLEMVGLTCDELTTDGELDFSICTLNRPSADLELADSALEMLAQFSPATFNLIEAMVSDIVLVGGNGLVGASSKKYLGGVLIGAHQNLSIADYLDTIVHEASHIELFIRSFVTPLINHPFSPLKSPIRLTDRPAEAVLHATFVVARSAQVLSELIAWSYDRHLNDRANILLDRNIKQAIEGLTTLQTSETLTISGARLISELENTIKLITYPLHEGPACDPAKKLDKDRS